MAEQKKPQPSSMFDEAAQAQASSAPVADATKASSTPPAPLAPPAPPAIPQILVDAGLQACFSAPRKAFIAAGGTDEEFAREVNFAISLMMKDDFLITCAKNNPDYLVEAIKAVGLTKLSLNPELKLAYLVPRKGKIYFSSSYMGKREILMRAGIVQWVEANLVYEGDVFEVSKGTSSGIVISQTTLVIIARRRKSRAVTGSPASRMAMSFSTSCLSRESMKSCRARSR